MTTILEDVYAHFGEQLSKDNRLKFVYNALSADHPSSCGAWEYLWYATLQEYRNRKRNFQSVTLGLRTLCLLIMDVPIPR